MATARLSFEPAAGGWETIVGLPFGRDVRRGGWFRGEIGREGE